MVFRPDLWALQSFAKLCSRKCHIIYRYGIKQASNRVHFLEDEEIDLTPEDGDCLVSDFCRVSIFEPTGSTEQESKRKVEETEKAQPSRSLHSRAGLPAPGTWYCSNCLAANSGLTSDLCPVCGQSR